MLEMAYGLPYKHDDHKTAINLIDAQLARNSQVAFAREQDRLEMIQFLHVARVESSNRKTSDLELLLNQIAGIFKPDEEAPEDDNTLQAALLAQACKTNFEHRGASLSSC